MLVSRSTIRLLRSIQGHECHGCINHEIVGLCSELLMRLSCYNHQVYGKNCQLSRESNPGPLTHEPLALTARPRLSSHSEQSKNMGKGLTDHELEKRCANRENLQSELTESK